MRTYRGYLLTVLALACGMQADAARRIDAAPVRQAVNAPQLMVGRLELEWGDPGAQAKALIGPEAQFRATLVDDAGVRRVLDTDQALRAAEDLYALYGRRIAVSTVPVAVQSKQGARPSVGRARRIDAIVPIDDLVVPVSAAKSTRARLTAQRAEAIGGVTTWVTLMCKFSDISTEQKTIDFFRSQYGSEIGQLDHYWQEVSYGQINLAGSDAYGWATLPEPRSFYVPLDPATGKEKANLNKLFEDCTAAHDANVNFAINGGVQGVNMMFNANLDGFAWGGSRCTTLDGINKCWSSTWNPPFSFNNLAPLSHEMGHAYGLPHANNSDTDTDPYDNPWDVMSDSFGNAVSNTTYGSLPKHISVYSRNRLGWVANDRKLTVTAGSSARSITVDRASLPGSSNRQMLILNYPDQSTRYYTLEVRKRTGNYENRLAGDAVIIHEVLTSRREPAWSMDTDTPPANRANNEGSMFKVGESWTSPDLAFRVKVESQTAEGFVVTVRRGPRKAGPGQAQQSPVAAKSAPNAASAPSRSSPSPLSMDKQNDRR